MAENKSSSNLKLVSRVETSKNKEKVKEENDYIGISLEKLSLSPSKKLLVLDLNGLLFRRFHIVDKDNIPKSRKPDAVFGKQLVFKRAFCDEFLKFCFQRFDVGIWSSGMEKNIKDAIDWIMGALRRKVLFTWDQSKCTESKIMTLEKGKPLFLKDLRKLWDSKGSSLPWRSGRFSSSNTLLIDDSPYKALLNPPNTGIFPQPYNVEDNKDAVLGPKGELRLYLEGLADADDVPSYVKAKSIGQPAITAVHPEWKNYSKVINEKAGGPSVALLSSSR